MDRLVGILAAALTGAAALCLVAMMGVTVADVALRAIDPTWRIFGVLDYVELSLAWLVYLGIAAATLTGAHVVVDAVDSIASPRLRGLLATLGAVALAAAFALALMQTIQPALDAREWGERTLDLGWPTFWYWCAVWAGLGLAVPCAALALPRAWREVREKAAPAP